MADDTSSIFSKIKKILLCSWRCKNIKKKKYSFRRNSKTIKEKNKVSSNEKKVQFKFKFE